MKTMDKLIKTIHVDRANFEHIAKHGNINGTLLVEIRRVMSKYINQQFDLMEHTKQVELLRKHGHNPIAVTTMMCEDTFIFETEKEATLAHEEMENTEHQKLQGWWYGKDDFFKAVVQYTTDHKTTVKITWL